METKPTEAECWEWFATLSDEEQVEVIQQAMDMIVEEEPKKFIKLPNGNYTRLSS
jgi:hypothetical protein